MAKHTENNEKSGKERVKMRFLQSLFHKTFFKKKRQIKIRKRISENLERGGKENENKKKRKIGRNLEKQDLQKVQRERKQRIQ